MLLWIKEVTSVAQKKCSFIDVWWIMVQSQSHYPVLLQSDPCVSLTLHGAILNPALQLHWFEQYGYKHSHNDIVVGEN